MLLPPSAENVSLAREIASELLQIATGSYAENWRSWDKPEIALSQSDRLVILAGRLGRISELLRQTRVDDLAPTASPSRAELSRGEDCSHD